MRRTLLLAVLVPAGALLIMAAGTAGWHLHRFLGKEPLSAPARGKTDAETRILATLADMKKPGRIQFGVPEADGRRLRLLAEAAGAKNVVEIGTSTGYSALWLCLGIQKTGGRITTFEMDAARVAAARENFRNAGVEGQITVVPGDAHKNIGEVSGPIDVLFLDADKEGYPDYLNKLLPLVRPGGLILAHNAERAPEYVQRVSGDPQLDTMLLTQGSGLSVTLKKR